MNILEYSKFVSEQLAPMSAENQKRHVELSLLEEHNELLAVVHERAVLDYKPRIKLLRANGQEIANFADYLSDIESKKELLQDKILKECGDVLFFLTAAKHLELGINIILDNGTVLFIGAVESLLTTLRNKYNWSIEYIAQNNFEKLTNRYGAGYSISKDINRKEGV